MALVELPLLPGIGPDVDYATGRAKRSIELPMIAPFLETVFGPYEFIASQVSVMCLLGSAVFFEKILKFHNCNMLLDLLGLAQWTFDNLLQPAKSFSTLDKLFLFERKLLNSPASF